VEVEEGLEGGGELLGLDVGERGGVVANDADLSAEGRVGGWAVLVGVALVERTARSTSLTVSNSARSMRAASTSRSGSSMRVMIRTVEYDSRPAAKASAMRGRWWSWRAMRSFS
jgi:hypothetical protein